MKKKLLLLKPFLVAPTNGGEISLIEFLEHFQKEWGWEIQIKLALPSELEMHLPQYLQQFGARLDSGCYYLNELRCDLHFDSGFHPTDLRAQEKMEAYFLNQCKEIAPDLVWTHYTDFFATSSALQWEPSRTWIHITDNEYPRPERIKEFPSLNNWYQKIEKLIVASPFMEESCRANWPQAEIFSLMRKIDRLKKPKLITNPEFWLFVNPASEKGGDFILDLASRMPDQKFLVVGNWQGDAPDSVPQNLKFIPRQRDLEEVFRSSIGLLYPSKWEEAFGRLPLEAMSAGVPVLASNRGSLPWTVGRGGQCLDLEVDGWIDAMRDLIIERERWIESGVQRVKDYIQVQQSILSAYQRRIEKEE